MFDYINVFEVKVGDVVQDMNRAILYQKCCDNRNKK